jgi:thiol-disulfide isomerase/thioredoxin
VAVAFRTLSANEVEVVRVVPCVLILALFCVGGTGCALFGKKSNDTGKGAWPTAQDKQTKSAGNGDPLKESGAAAGTSEVQGMLSGQVLDRRTGDGVKAYIRLVRLDEPAAKGAPVDIATDGSGFFTIQGLKAGKKYKLVARTTHGSQTIAGISYATPPNPRVAIQLGTQFPAGDVPPVPAPSTLPGTTVPDTPPGKDGAKKNDKASGHSKGLAIGPPTPLAESAQGFNQPDWTYPPKQTEQPAPPKKYLQGVVEGDNPRPYSPPVKINNPNGQAPQPQSLPREAPEGVLPKSTTPLPSAVLIGGQLINFALLDVYGTPWEWKTNRRGRLVLLDFWMTNCVPCLESMPNLCILQREFGPQGLEVIGIATEHGISLEEAKNRVGRIANIKNTNYRLLLNTGPQSSIVLEKFGVQRFPTMILLNEQGRILWRHEGALTGPVRDDLEHRIRWALGSGLASQK